MKDSEDIKQGLEFINRKGFSHPSVQEACTHLGISPDELIQRTLQTFLQTTSKELAEIHYRHHEARRRAKLILISKYIQEKSLSPSAKTLQINRTLSTSSTKYQKSLISPSNKSNSKIEEIKKKLIKKLRIAKNLQNIKVEAEKKRKNFEEKIFAKSCRSDRKLSPEKTNRFALHELRIKEILTKKYRDIEEHERRAFSSMSSKREVSNTFSSSFQHQKIRGSKLPEINIDEKLREFDQKMIRSSERAKKALVAKANSSSALSTNRKRAKSTKEELDSRMEKQAIDRIYKIGKNIMDSTKRREKLLENQQKRINLSLQSQKNRWDEEMSKISKVQAEREKQLEEKSTRKEKVAQMIKKSIDREVQETISRNSIRKKKDHELNITRLQRQYEQIRSKILTKVKDSENKQKPEIDIEKLKLKLESKLMSQLNF